MDELLKQNIFKENFSKNRNVLVLVGHLRTVKFLLKYHKKFLQKTNSDLIISTWADDETEPETFDLIKKKLKPVYFEIEEFNFNLTENIFGNLNKFDMMFGKGNYEILKTPLYKEDVLDWVDKKSYKERLKQAKKKTNEQINTRVNKLTHERTKQPTNNQIG